MDTSEKTKEWLMEQLQKEKVEETFNDEKESFYGDGVNLLEKALEDSSPENQEEMEEVEIRKPNRHERRRRAKLTRMQETRDKAEVERRKDKNRKEKGK